MAHQFDVLIIGSGLAGLTLALHLAEKRKVGLVTKKELLDGASNWAQGVEGNLDSSHASFLHKFFDLSHPWNFGNTGPNINRRPLLSDDGAPVLIVNSEHLNFVDTPADFDLLLQRIAAMRGNREFFSLGE